MSMRTCDRCFEVVADGDGGEVDVVSSAKGPERRKVILCSRCIEMFVGWVSPTWHKRCYLEPDTMISRLRQEIEPAAGPGDFDPQHDQELRGDL